MNHSGNLQSVQSREFFAISEFLFLLYQIEPGSSFGDHVVRCFSKVFPDLKISCHQRQEEAREPFDRTVTKLGSGQDQSITEENQKLFSALMPHIRNASQIAARISPKETSTNDLERFDLTRREKEVALWMKEGKRDKEIAVILGISSRTVEKHVHQILEKLQVENRSSATAVLTEARLIWNILRDSSTGHGRAKP